jgi:hypothetical protein
VPGALPQAHRPRVIYLRNHLLENKSNMLPDDSHVQEACFFFLSHAMQAHALSLLLIAIFSILWYILYGKFYIHALDTKEDSS